MRQFYGVSALLDSSPESREPRRFAEKLLEDLQDCHCRIFGALGDDVHVLLAELTLLPGGLEYEPFDQRIDLTLAGPILRGDCVPLTYRLQGRVLAISGRCSMIPRVCGVDLYLSHTYTGRVGDITRQRFSISIKSLLQQ